MKLLAELKRRNVFRMAGLYVVGAWLIVQVAETVLPAFDVPGWVLRATIILLAIGFVPALVFSWIYELTPEGLKRDADIDPARSIAPRTAQRMDQLTLASVLILLAVIAADRHHRPERLAAFLDRTWLGVIARASALAGDEGWLRGLAGGAQR